jgi:tetratricopeptide (TPR) repeat protein
MNCQCKTSLPNPNKALNINNLSIRIRPSARQSRPAERKGFGLPATDRASQADCYQAVRKCWPQTREPVRQFTLAGFDGALAFRLVISRVLQWARLLAPFIAVQLAASAPLAVQARKPSRPLRCYIAEGSYALKKGGLKQAEDEFRAALQAYPGFNEAREDLGIVLAREGQFDAAAGEFRKVLTARPDLAEAHQDLALALWQKGNLDGAEKEFRSAAHLGSAEALLSVGVILGEKGQLKAATAVAQRVVKLLPNDPDSHLLLGGSLEQQGDLDGALAELQRAAKLDPERAGVRLQLGIVQRQRGDLQDAVSNLREAVEIDPGDAKARCELGAALYRAGDPGDAVTELRRAVSLGSKQPQAFYVLSRALEQTGDYQGAKAALVEVDRLRQADRHYAQAVIQYDLGVQQLKSGDLHSALKSFQAAVSLDPDLAQARTNLGAVLSNMGNVKSAIGEFRAAIDLQPDDAHAYYDLGEALAKERDIKDSRDAFQRAAALDPRLQTR